MEDTIAAFEGRTIHTYHTEGAGGGHAPDIIKVAGQINVLPELDQADATRTASTAQAELFDMIMVCHNFNPKVPSDVAFVESRVRPETIAAEDVLHDVGVISMMGSDSQAMGRIGETWLRTIQIADAMKTARGKLPRGRAGQRQLPGAALRRQGDHQPGDHRRGSPTSSGRSRRARWPTWCCGSRRSSARSRSWSLKGGMIAWSIMGDPNASLPTPQPIYYRPMFGAFGSRPARDLRDLRLRGPATRTASRSSSACSGRSCRYAAPAA